MTPIAEVTDASLLPIAGTVNPPDMPPAKGCFLEFLRYDEGCHSVAVRWYDNGVITGDKSALPKPHGEGQFDYWRRVQYTQFERLDDKPGDNVAAPAKGQVSRGRALLGRIWPVTAYRYFAPNDKALTHRTRIDSYTRLDFRDTLRALFSGWVHVRCVLFSEHSPGKTEAASQLVCGNAAKPPKSPQWLPPRPAPQLPSRPKQARVLEGADMIIPGDYRVIAGITADIASDQIGMTVQQYRDAFQSPEVIIYRAVNGNRVEPVEPRPRPQEPKEEPQKEPENVTPYVPYEPELTPQPLAFDDWNAEVSCALKLAHHPLGKNEDANFLERLHFHRIGMTPAQYVSATLAIEKGNAEPVKVNAIGAESDALEYKRCAAVNSACGSCCERTDGHTGHHYSRNGGIYWSGEHHSPMIESIVMLEAERQTAQMRAVLTKLLTLEERHAALVRTHHRMEKEGEEQAKEVRGLMYDLRAMVEAHGGNTGLAVKDALQILLFEYRRDLRAACENIDALSTELSQRKQASQSGRLFGHAFVTSAAEASLGHEMRFQGVDGWHPITPQNVHMKPQAVEFRAPIYIQN